MGQSSLLLFVVVVVVIYCTDQLSVRVFAKFQLGHTCEKVSRPEAVVPW